MNLLREILNNVDHHLNNGLFWESALMNRNINQMIDTFDSLMDLYDEKNNLYYINPWIIWLK